MGIVRQVAILVLVLSVAVFITFFGRLPIFRRTPIGSLHRLLWIHIPNGLSAIDLCVTGGRLGLSLTQTGHYLMYERHPIVLIFFLIILVVSELLFIPQSLHLLPITFFQSRIHLLLHYTLIPLLIIPPYIFLYLSVYTHSNINPVNHSIAMLTYPYDNVIFYGPGSGPLSPPPCRTCQFAKPARSKHCSICRSCIQKADHHCVWVNNCVGRNNHAYFLALMFSVSVLLAYGAYLGYEILDRQIQLLFFQHLPSTTNHHNYDHHWAQSLPWKTYAQRWSDALNIHPFIATPALLALLCCPLATGLTLYHIYLIWAGMTTNESGKWANLREDIGEGRVWRARFEDLEDDFPGIGQTSAGGSDLVTWPLKPGWLVVVMEEPGRRPRARTGVTETTERGNEGEGLEGGAVADIDGDADRSVQDERWIQVKSLNELENIYDLGFWNNLKDVILNTE